MKKRPKTAKKHTSKRKATPKQLAARRKFTEMVRSKSRSTRNKSKHGSSQTMRKGKKMMRRGGKKMTSFNGVLKSGLGIFKDSRVQGVAKGAGVAAVIGPALDSAAPQVSQTLTPAGQRIALGVLGGGLEGALGGLIAYAGQSGRLSFGNGGGMGSRYRGSRV